MMLRRTLLATTLILPLACGAADAACTVTVGAVMPLTGPAGAYGQAAAKSIELAFRDINGAGGVPMNGEVCTLGVDVRDTQSQGTVAVDAARQLVDLVKVPVIIGGIISSESIPVLTSVTAPAGIVQVSPASSSPTLTEIARRGESKGLFFRTITSDALQGVAAAKYALDKGLKKVAIIHANNDFGANMVREFSAAYAKLGGSITGSVAYNESQPSYGAEVTKALEGEPEALYLVSYPGDGATIARTWISQGGVQRFLLNDGLNSADFIANVGPEYLNEAYGTSSGTTTTPSTEYFTKTYPEFTGGAFDAGAPAADRAYDAAAIVGLALAQAGSGEANAVTAAIRAVTSGDEVIHAGPDGMAKGLAALKAGRTIRYEGVIGPTAFDQHGDITGPFRLWTIKDGTVTTEGQMSDREVAELKAQIGG